MKSKLKLCGRRGLALIMVLVMLAGAFPVTAVANDLVTTTEFEPLDPPPDIVHTGTAEANDLVTTTEFEPLDPPPDIAHTGTAAASDLVMTTEPETLDLTSDIVQSGTEAASSSVTITEFEPLDPTPVTVITGTAEGDVLLKLPTTLNAMADGGGGGPVSMPVPVTWTSMDYDAETPGSYTFTAEPTDGETYVLDGCSWPTATVTVVDPVVTISVPERTATDGVSFDAMDGVTASDQLGNPYSVLITGITSTDGSYAYQENDTSFTPKIGYTYTVAYKVTYTAESKHMPRQKKPL